MLVSTSPCPTLILPLSQRIQYGFMVSHEQMPGVSADVSSEPCWHENTSSRKSFVRIGWYCKGSAWDIRLVNSIIWINFTLLPFVEFVMGYSKDPAVTTEQHLNLCFCQLWHRRDMNRRPSDQTRSCGYAVHHATHLEADVNWWMFSVIMAVNSSQGEEFLVK